MEAQQAKTIAGTYFVNGIMETASGFQVNEDSTFKFFFSQGGLDRGGSGTWAVQDGKVVFNSKPYPGKDFAMVESKTVPGDSVTIKIVDKNTYLTSCVFSVLFADGVDDGRVMNEHGEVHFPKGNYDQLILIFQFSAERRSLFTIDTKEHNYFEFRFEPWAMEYFFEGFALDMDGVHLKGEHPFMEEGDVFVYEKE